MINVGAIKSHGTISYEKFQFSTTSAGSGEQISESDVLIKRTEHERADQGVSPSDSLVGTVSSSPNNTFPVTIRPYLIDNIDWCILDAVNRYKQLNAVEPEFSLARPLLATLKSVSGIVVSKITFYEDGAKIRMQFAQTDFIIDFDFEEPTSLFITTNAMFPLFLSTTKLYAQPINFSGEKFMSSFLHKPTRINYWHFQLFTRDDKGKVIPRDKDRSRLKHLAKHILENIVIPAICPKTAIKRFQKIDFDRTANEAG
jgi:hypothetical protein